MSLNQAAVFEFVKSCARRKYVFGEFDCLTFTNEAFRAAWGWGYADDWIGKYHNGGELVKPKLLQARVGASSFEEAIGRKLVQQPVSFLGRGSIIMADTGHSFPYTEGALGIITGRVAMCVGLEGLVPVNIQDIQKGWAPCLLSQQ